MTSNGSGYYYYDENTRIWGIGNGPINTNANYLQFNNTLDMSNNNITDISSLIFHNNTYLTSGDFSGNSSSNIKSLIYNNNGTDYISNPVSIMRMSHFTSDISYVISLSPTSQTPIRFGNQSVNQLGITFVDINRTQFILPDDLSGQFIEIYVIQKTNVSNNYSVTVDISSINNTYNENIDTRYYNKVGPVTSTFGPHMVRADEIRVGKIYSLFTYAVGSGGGNHTLIRSEVIMKSYYV
jgi:hypothetical protein